MLRTRIIFSQPCFHIQHVATITGDSDGNNRLLRKFLSINGGNVTQRIYHEGEFVHGSFAEGFYLFNDFCLFNNCKQTAVLIVFCSILMNIFYWYDENTKKLRMCGHSAWKLTNIIRNSHMSNIWRSQNEIKLNGPK